MRILTACLVASIAPGISMPWPPSSYANELRTICPELSLKADFLCVELEVKDQGDHHQFVQVDWGDGAVEWFDTFFGSGTFPHKYTGTGSYLIKVTAPTSCLGLGINQIMVQVQEPLSFSLVAFEVDNWIQPATWDSIETTSIQKSMVSWGDGTPFEEFQWTDCLMPGALCAPQHLYASAGVYTIIISNEYVPNQFGCQSIQTAHLTVTVDPPTPVESATWGAIKALYR